MEEITPFREEDLEEVVKVYLEGYKGLEEYSYTDERDVKSYINWLLRRDKENFLVLRLKGKIVGFIAGDDHWFSKRERSLVGAIHEIVIKPKYQGRGYGKRLMLEMLKRFKEKKLKKAELWVGEENYRAINFYKSLGFKESGRFSIWIRMVKDLA